ncbi:hypothetical protein [Falsiroseomonas selenitidurans]|uniref:Uncharacterized protein n=1 Tax=Falsiroseomonas selenitidurans TaxID=2716335 RepID=A0ABX1E972_9PROT|nr:hypothetical protein [Falsiroseomonas selenitidurans]NKC33498.1 hypothetical protein [Falsiroseomonas selenitidurans]
METPVLSAAQRREVVLDGTAYTLAPPTLGRLSALQAERAGEFAPTEAVLTYLLADALRETHPELVAALEDYEVAQDEVTLLHMSRPPEVETEGRRAWQEERGAELHAAYRRQMQAGRKRELALHLAAASPQVRDARAAMLRARDADARVLVRACLVAIDGEAVEMADAGLDALPSHHMAALAAVAVRLVNPGQDAAKN